MMRYQNGWVKLHRSLRDKDFYSDANLTRVALDLLLLANYKKSKVLVNGKLRELLPGQALITLREIGVKLLIPHKTVERTLERLTVYGFMTREVTQRGTIITICNYEKYQTCDPEPDTALDTEVTHERHRSDTEVTLYKESKNTDSSIAAVALRALCVEDINRSSSSPGNDLIKTRAPANEMNDPKPKRVRKAKEPKPVTDGSRVWLAYAAAYEKRWSTAPIRNAKANKQCSLLVNHLGAIEAPLVAEFYLSHNDKYIVQQLHPLGLLVNSHQRFRTEWAANQQMTSTLATQIDQTKSTEDVFSRALKRWTEETEVSE